MIENEQTSATKSTYATLPPPVRAARMLAIVKRIASSIARRLPKHIETDDLFGAGSVGLAEAYRRRGDMHGDMFEAFAACRVRGAILDELRRNDPLSRRLRSIARSIDDASAATATMGEKANGEAVAHKLGIDPARYRALQLSKRASNATDQESESVRDPASSPEQLVDEKQRKELLAAAAEKLPARLRFVVVQRYVHDVTLREVGVRLNVSESRACQMEREALARLAALLRTSDIGEVA